jgi:RNA recognition motif-containing protein
LQSGPHTIDDKAIDAKKAIPHAVHQKMKNKTKKLFVGGVPTDMPEETIRSYFESFGPIEEIALVTEKGSGPKGEKKRRGFIFVTFESEDVAETACSKPFHKIESVSVEVKKATPRESESRRVQYYADHPQFMGRGAMRGNFFQAQHGRGANWAPYGGHAYFSFIPPPYGGGYMGGGYGGYNTYGGYAYDQYSGGNRRDDANYNSRYGPMRSNYTNNHSHSHHPHHHPYSR